MYAVRIDGGQSCDLIRQHQTGIVAHLYSDCIMQIFWSTDIDYIPQSSRSQLPDASVPMSETDVVKVVPQRIPVDSVSTRQNR
jgi:hypothetical protein